jgi:imidazolonepropionase-like amidohydrolase
MLQEQGVVIAVGTDTGNPFVFPGYSVHRELELLVQAGLTPMQALEAGTRRAADMVRADDAFGTIEVGKRADLLILRANPLENIRNTRTLEVVVSEGRVVDRVKLQEKRDK